MKKFLALLAAFLMFSCSDDDDSFPSHIKNKYYDNGHSLAINEVTNFCQNWEEQLFELVNEIRVVNNCKPLKRNAALDAVARAHSDHMFEHAFYGHENPEGDNPRERMRRTCGDFGVGENVWIVSINDSPKFIMDGFMASEPHRKNILTKWVRRVGIGLVRVPSLYCPDTVAVTMLFY